MQTHPGIVFAGTPSPPLRAKIDVPGADSGDVGPLLVVAAHLRDQQPLDDATRALLDVALRRALTGAASSP